MIPYHLVASCNCTSYNCRLFALPRRTISLKLSQMMNLLLCIGGIAIWERCPWVLSVCASRFLCVGHTALCCHQPSGDSPECCFVRKQRTSQSAATSLFSFSPTQVVWVASCHHHLSRSGHLSGVQPHSSLFWHSYIPFFLPSLVNRFVNDWTSYTQTHTVWKLLLAARGLKICFSFPLPSLITRPLILLPTSLEVQI